MRWRKLIKDNQKNFSRLHMLIDVFVIAASYALAWLDPVSREFCSIRRSSPRPSRNIMFMLIIHYSGIFTSLSGL